jgi:hypothetical protein
MESEANLTSFVLRFVFDQSLETTESAVAPIGQAWHGVIRHVQTNQERHFMRWAEAVAFVEQYIDLGEERNE